MDAAAVAAAAVQARMALIEAVAEAEEAEEAVGEAAAEVAAAEGYQGQVAEAYLSGEPVPPALLRDALRRLTLSGAGVPWKATYSPISPLYLAHISPISPRCGRAALVRRIAPRSPPRAQP